jgi:5-methylcytosine-specific restriction endonuclease McrA
VDWRIVRDEFLAYHPKCQARDEAALRDHARFGDVATDVDHVKARRAGGTDDWGNLQALCHRCHSRKTLGDMGSKS